APRGGARRRRDGDAAAPPDVPELATSAGARPRARAPGMMAPVVAVEALGLRFDGRELWHDLTFQIERGEFLAVLGPNGAGKTSLLRILLGQLEPTSGRVVIDRSRVGYVPQQRVFDRDLPLRGRDLVRFGLDGHKWGVGRLGTRPAARRRGRRGGGSIRAGGRTARPALRRRAAAAAGCAGARVGPEPPA